MTGEELYATFCATMDAKGVKLGVVPWRQLHDDAHAGWDQLAEDLMLDAPYRLIFKDSEWNGQPVSLIHLAGTLPYVDPDNKQLGLKPDATETQKTTYIAIMALTDDPRECKMPTLEWPVAVMQATD